MEVKRAAITAVGHYVPEKILTNKDFEKMVDTNDEWIRTRTGIEERRILDKDKPTSYMAVKAIEQVLERRGITGEDIDLIIVGTVTPDMLFPATACIIQEKIGKAIVERKRNANQNGGDKENEIGFLFEEDKGLCANGA